MFGDLNRSAPATLTAQPTAFRSWHPATRETSTKSISCMNHTRTPFRTCDVHREHEVGFGSGYVVGEKLLGFAEGGGTSRDRTGPCRSTGTFRWMSLRRATIGFCDALAEAAPISRKFADVVGFGPTIMERTIMVMDRAPSRNHHDKTHGALPVS